MQRLYNAPYFLTPRSYTSGFTQVGNFSPRKPAIKFCAVIVAILLRVCTDALAMCGTTMQFGKFNSGLSKEIGSGSVTSSAAPAIVPALSASERA